jgi:hypothetical protein
MSKVDVEGLVSNTVEVELCRVFEDPGYYSRHGTPGTEEKGSGAVPLGGDSTGVRGVTEVAYSGVGGPDADFLPAGGSLIRQVSGPGRYGFLR